MKEALALLLLLPGLAAAEPAPLPPVTPACISSPFGAREAAGPRASRFHSGIDLPAPAGAGVRAALAGEVVAIRRLGAAGLEVQVRHADATVARYAHLGSVAPALAGGRRQVAQGERIGRVGRTGVTYGTHLHLELHREGQAVDPAPWLGLARCPPRP
jgi:murein DD-endopeptidase MepM/ murein hydrolase activator NlpD